jgi:hypothetical protein
VPMKCRVEGCACGGKLDESETHDAGLRMGTDEFSFPIMVSSLIPDPPGFIFLSGDWKP